MISRASDRVNSRGGAFRASLLFAFKEAIMSCGGCSKRRGALSGAMNRPANGQQSAAQRAAQRAAVVAKHFARDVKRSVLPSRRGK